MIKCLLASLILLLPLQARALVVNSTPGELANLMQTDKNIVDLVVNGEIDARDLQFIKDELKSLVSLDLSGAKIVGYNAKTPLFGSQLNFNSNEIPDCAFFGSQIKNITLPQGITRIGDSAFAGCSLMQAISLPHTLTSVGDYAFYDCDAITSIHFPTSVTGIGAYACANCNMLASASIAAACSLSEGLFSGCSVLNKIDLPQTLSTIGDDAFNGCAKLSDIKFPESLTGIGSRAFYGTALSVVDLSPNAALTSVGHWAFAANTAMTEMKLPANLSEVGAGAFAFNASLAKATLPQGIKVVSDYLFAQCHTIDPTGLLPESVEHIGRYAFAEWDRTTSFSFPENVSEIGDYAFENWTSVKSFTANVSSVPVLGENVFFGIHQASVTLSVPDNLKSQFEMEEQWKNFNIVALSGSHDAKINDEDSIRVAFAENTLHVKSSRLVAEALLYDTSGALLAKVMPNAETFTINTGDFVSNYYILTIKHADSHIDVVKLARR